MLFNLAAACFALSVVLYWMRIKSPDITRSLGALSDASLALGLLFLALGL